VLARSEQIAESVAMRTPGLPPQIAGYALAQGLAMAWRSVRASAGQEQANVSVPSGSSSPLTSGRMSSTQRLMLA